MMWKTWNLQTLLMGRQNDTFSSMNSSFFFFFNKLTTHLLYDPKISFYLSKRNENFGSQEDLYVNVDSGFFIIHKPRNKPDIL